MARGPRLVVPGVALHVVQRGHNRRDCFQHETDYLVYLSNLHELATKTQCALHAYCLMTNHVHLLLTPGSPDACARLMKQAGQLYVQHVNRIHGRTGTLWEGRYRSSVAALHDVHRDTREYGSGHSGHGPENAAPPPAVDRNSRK